MTRVAAIAFACAFGAFHAAAVAPSLAEPIKPVAARTDVQTGVHEAAAQAVQGATAVLSRPGGFFRTPEFHIPLPKTLDDVVDSLKSAYAPELSVALERAINRAAEASAKPAGDFLATALPKLDFADPNALAAGPPDAITKAIRKQLEAPFRAAMRPVIQANLTAVEAPAALQRMRARYEKATNAAFPDFDLVGYTVDSFTDAYFAAVAKKELEIRQRPSSRATEAVRSLFAN